MRAVDALSLAARRRSEATPARRFLMYAALFMTGGAAYYLGLEIGVPNRCLPAIGELLVKAHNGVGWVLYPLLATTAYLMVLMGRQLVERLGHRPHTFSAAARYSVVEWLSPLLGLLGTVVALGSAMKGLDISMGMQDAIGELNFKVGQALNSTIFGVILAIVAGLLRSLTLRGEEGTE